MNPPATNKNERIYDSSTSIAILTMLIMLTHDSFLAAHVGSNTQMGFVGKDNKHLFYNSIHDMHSQSF